MKKLLLILFVIIISGCKNTENNYEFTIKFWHFWSEPNQKQALLYLVENFEKENNCKVELTELSWNDGKTKLITAFSSDVQPDVLELGSDWIAQFSSTNVLMDLTNDSINFDDYLDYSLPPVRWNNRYYAVPWIVDTRVLFYNKKLMKDAGLPDIPPTNYSELIEFADIINQPDNNIYGFGANGQDPHRLYKKVLPIIWSNGGDILDATGSPRINSITNIDAINIYLQLSRCGIIETQRQLDSYFSQGKIGFVFSGAWLLEKIKNENPNLDFGVALVPAISGKKEHGTSFLGAEYLAISKKTSKKELALKLVKYLSDGNNALTLAKKFPEAGFPADKKYSNSTELLSDNYKKVFAEQLKYAKATPVHPRWLDIQECLESKITSTLYNQMDVYSALNSAQIEVLQLLNNK
ncbi:MAG: extracellular solute-binding protein [Bacteroidetes bacterium]|nr:extracellular solute-binding protein [Bacteroidota bacterium]